MYFITVVTILLVSTFVNVQSLTDDELEKVKTMVNAELEKRQTDVILSGPDKLVARTTKKPKTTTTELLESEIDNSIDNCFDMYETKKCKLLINEWKMSCDKDRLKEMCEKSCGYCGNHMNPLIDCHTTQYGCCDDNLTPKTDPYGSKCPVCKDNVKSLCEGHVQDCNEVDMVGQWMRTNCKETCHQCDTRKPIKPKCEDKAEKDFCSSWKGEGLCTQISSIMNVHCAKTCGAC